jgi:acetylornithine deacetylase
MPNYDAARILAAVDTAELVELAQQLVRIPSYTGSPGEGDASRFLHAHLSGLGLESELMAVDESRFNVVARSRGSGGGKTLMFNGHVDTNAVVLGWTEDPFGGAVKDGWIYGVGICNMKGADAAYIAALQAVWRAGLPLRGDVLFAYVVGEQQGGFGTLKLLERGITADYFVDGEPCENVILTLHAGVASFRLSTIGRMRHTSKQEESVSAIDLMIRVITGLKELQFSGPDDPRYQGLRRLNVGSIRGGMGREYLEWRPPIVPDFCSIHLDVRYGPGQSHESVEADIRAMLEQLKQTELPELRWELDPLDEVSTIRKGRFSYFEIPEDHEVVQTVARAYGTVYGEQPRIGPVPPYKFYGTDAAHLWHRGGIPGVVCGPGGKQTTSANEAMEIDELVKAAQIYALVIAELCS